jgi:hypothetical protein
VTVPDPIAALAAAVQTAGTALVAAEDALSAATELVEQDQAARYDRLDRQALTVRLAVAERTIARLAAQEPAAPEATATASGEAERTYDLQVQEDDGRWIPCIVRTQSTRSASGICSELARVRGRADAQREGWIYRATYQDLPEPTPLTDAELDALVLAEQPEEGR